jgi:hypothetical protein
VQYYGQVIEYLANVPQYHWLVSPDRTIKKVLVYSVCEGIAARLSDTLCEKAVALLSLDSILKEMVTLLKVHKQEGLRTNNQVVKLLDLLQTKQLMVIQ